MSGESAKSLAAHGELYSIVDRVFTPWEPQEFAGGLCNIRRSRINEHYRSVLSEIGLAEVHTSKSSSDITSPTKSNKLRGNPAENGGKLDVLGALGGEDAHAVPDSERAPRRTEHY